MKPRWDIPTQTWIGPVPADSRDTLDAGPIPAEQGANWHGDDECRHSWFRVSGADRYRCSHCGKVAIFNSEP